VSEQQAPSNTLPFAFLAFLLTYNGLPFNHFIENGQYRPPPRFRRARPLFIDATGNGVASPAAESCLRHMIWGRKQFTRMVTPRVRTRFPWTSEAGV